MGRQVVLGMALCIGCGADTITTEAPETSATTDEMPPPTTEPGTTTGADSSSSDAEESSEGSESTGAPPAECGNGIVEEGEDCEGDEGYCRDCRLPCRLDAHMVVADPDGRAMYLSAIDVGPDGQIVAVGDIEEHPGDTAVVLARIEDFEGNFELATYDVGDGDDTGNGISIDAEGAVNVLVGDDNFFYSRTVVHLDPSGEVAWIADKVDQTLPNGLALTADGGVVVSGTGALGTGDSDVVVIGFEGGVAHPLGSFTTNPVGAAPNDRGGPLTVADDGIIYVAALGPSVQGGVTVGDPLVVAFDPVAEKPIWDWSVFLGSTNLGLLGKQIVVDAAGNVHALYQLVHGSSNSAHFQLWQFSPDGEQTGFFDSEELDYDGGEVPAGLVADEDGRVIIVAQRDGSSAGDHEGDMIVLGFEPDGAIACEERFAGAPTRASGVARTDDGDIVVSGIDWGGPVLAGTVTRIRGFAEFQ